MQNELNHCEVVDFIEARNRHYLSHNRLEIDVDRYQSYLDQQSLTESQRREFVHALWAVVVAFVDLGYGVHPVQSCEAKIVTFPPQRRRRADQPVERGGAAHV